MLPQTARGHRGPLALQFSVFLANRVGQLKELLNTFSSRSVKVLGLSIVDSTDWAVVRVVFSDAEKGREILKGHSVPFTESEVILAELGGDHALVDISMLLLRAEINLHFAYLLMIRRHGNPVIVLHVDDPVIACQVLLKHGVGLVGEGELEESL